MSNEQIEQMVRYLKALADESRLRILGLLASEERSVEELAELLGLRSPTVSHHLAKLREAGLVSMRAEGNTHLHVLELNRLQSLKEELFSPRGIAQIPEGDETLRWERRVLANFTERDRLKEIPSSRKKREVVLRWLVGRFAFDERYPERRVNELIERHHPDFATLRRELVGAGLMARENGEYWRLQPLGSSLANSAEPAGSGAAYPPAGAVQGG